MIVVEVVEVYPTLLAPKLMKDAEPELVLAPTMAPPTTCSFAVGEVVPTPMLPPLVAMLMFPYVMLVPLGAPGVMVTLAPDAFVPPEPGVIVMGPARTPLTPPLPEVIKTDPPLVFAPPLPEVIVTFPGIALLFNALPDDRFTEPPSQFN